MEYSIKNISGGDIQLGDYTFKNNQSELLYDSDVDISSENITFFVDNFFGDHGLNYHWFNDNLEFYIDEELNSKDEFFRLWYIWKNGELLKAKTINNLNLMSIEFNGIDQKIIFDPCEEVQGINEFTVGGWIFINERIGRKGSYIITQESNSGSKIIWSICIDKDSHPCFEVYTDQGYYSVTSGIAINPNQWYHIMGVKSSTEIQLFIDSNYTTSLSVEGNMLSSDSSISIAGHTKKGKHFKGFVDEVVIIDKALTRAERFDYYNNGNILSLINMTFYPNIISWWRMGDNNDSLIAENEVRDQKDKMNGTAKNFRDDTSIIHFVKQSVIIKNYI